MAAAHRRLNRGGFTLVEVVVALTLLAAMALFLGVAAARLTGSAARDAQQLAALDLVNERIGRIQADLAYPALEARYAGVENNLETMPGGERSTTIRHILQTHPDGRRLDYKIVEVQVAGPGLAAPVRRSVIVAAP